MPIGVVPSAEEPAPSGPPPDSKIVSPKPAEPAEPAKPEESGKPSVPKKEMLSRLLVRVSEVGLVVLMAFFAYSFFGPARAYAESVINAYRATRSVDMTLSVFLDPMGWFLALFVLAVLSLLSVGRRRIGGAVYAILVFAASGVLITWSMGIQAFGLGAIAFLGAGIGFGIVLFFAYRGADPRDQWLLWVVVTGAIAVGALHFGGSYISSPLENALPSFSEEVPPDGPSTGAN